MVLLHKGQHIFQTCFNAQIEIAHTGIIELFQFPIGLLGDVGNGGIHIHPLTAGEIVVNPLQDPQQMRRIQAEGIAIAQKYRLGITPCGHHPLQFRLDLFIRKLAVAQMFEERTKRAGIVGAAHRHGQHIRSPFHRRTADLTFVIHTSSLLCNHYICPKNRTQ